MMNIQDNINKHLAHRRQRYGLCPLCEREIALSFHHLIPKKMHRRTLFKKSYSKAELNIGVNICKACHLGIHKTYDEMTLAKRFCTIDALKSDEVLNLHFMWVAKQKISSRKA